LLDNGGGLVAEAGGFVKLALDQAGFGQPDMVKGSAPQVTWPPFSNSLCNAGNGFVGQFYPLMRQF
jgi:hypothetical protein